MDFSGKKHGVNVLRGDKLVGYDKQHTGVSRCFYFLYNRCLLEQGKGHEMLSLSLQSMNSIYLSAAGIAKSGFCQPVNSFFFPFFFKTESRVQ